MPQSKPKKARAARRAPHKPAQPSRVRPKAARAAPKAAAKKGRRNPTLPAANPADTEAKIIASLSNPEHRELTVTKRCQEIGIGRRTWYDRLAEPLFRARARSAWRELLDEEMTRVVGALTRNALLDGRDGHPDRKLFFQLAGELEGGPAGGRPGDQEGAEKSGKAEMSDEEIIEAFRGYEEHLPEGIRHRLQQAGRIGQDGRIL